MVEHRRVAGADGSWRITGWERRALYHDGDASLWKHHARYFFWGLWAITRLPGEIVPERVKVRSGMSRAPSKVVDVTSLEEVTITVRG